MFCDLQGPSALSQQLEPEDLREVIRGYQEVCAGAISRYDGHIAKYLGDGLLIYFGYPLAHEDDPQRAVQAGLTILEDMAGLNARLKADKDLELAVRIGVHTGLVVAGEIGGGDSVEALAIVSETPNVAARLQEAVKPDTVVISDITANLVQGYFLCEALGFQDLKGVSQPMELFGVLSESGAQTRFDVAVAARLTRRLATDMVDRLTGDKTLPEEIITQVASKSDRVPLFVEELINMVIESGLVKIVDNRYELNGPLEPLAIPSTLQDSLTARLDRLSNAREVVQLGTVLGREFSYELMQSVSPLNEATLE